MPIVQEKTAVNQPELDVINNLQNLHVIKRAYLDLSNKDIDTVKYDIYYESYFDLNLRGILKAININIFKMAYLKVCSESLTIKLTLKYR